MKVISLHWTSHMLIASDIRLTQNPIKIMLLNIISTVVSGLHDCTYKHVYNDMYMYRLVSYMKLCTTSIIMYTYDTNLHEYISECGTGSETEVHIVINRGRGKGHIGYRLPFSYMSAAHYMHCDNQVWYRALTIYNTLVVIADLANGHSSTSLMQS